MSLPLVPLDRVQIAFDEIVNLKPLNNIDNIAKFDKFIMYFKDIWLNSSSFPIVSWNHFDTQGPRTNNYLEGYNNSINKINEIKNQIDSMPISEYLSKLFKFNNNKQKKKKKKNSKN